MTTPFAQWPLRARFTAIMALACVFGSPAASAAQAPAGGTESAAEAAHRRLTEYLDAGKGPLRTWTEEEGPRLCELWLAYARAMGLPESPREYLELHMSVPAEFRKSSDYSVSAAVTGLMSLKYPCPPPAPPAASRAAVVPGGNAEKGGIRGKALLVGAGAAAAGAVVLAAAGGGDSGSGAPATTTPPTTAPPNVSNLHGLYIGRLTTGNPSIPGCGRAATGPCNAQIGGSANGTPASLSFGGDLPSSGVLRPNGAMESFRYEGPANGLAGLPGGVLILWQQQGTIANNVLTLEGTATVTSPGPCSGAVITTRVEATRN